MEIAEQYPLLILWATPLWGVVSFFWAQKLGFFLPTEEKEGKSWFNFGHVLLAFLGYFVTQLAVGFAFRSWWQEAPTHQEAIMGQAMVQLIAIGVSTLFLLWIAFWKTTRSIWGFFKKQAFWKGALSWFIIVPWVLFVSGLFSWFVQDFLGHSPIDQDPVRYLKALAFNPWLFWLTALAMVTVIPLSEEILFRGFLQTYLTRLLPIGWAIFLAALIFTLFHFSYAQGLSNLEVLPPLFLLSCFLGYLRVHTASLYASIGLHSIFNLINVIFLFFFE